MRTVRSELRAHPLRGTRRIVQSIILSRIGRTNITVPFGDTKIRVDLNISLGLEIYRYGVWDDVLSYITSALRPGDVFLDCGANIGLMTVTAAERVGPHGRVVAFEPGDAARRALEVNIATGGHKNVTILPWALGERSETRDFVVMDDGGGLSSFAPEFPANGTVTTVSVRSLDEVVSEMNLTTVRLVKLDIEGAEVKALRGASKLLASGCEFIVEVEARHLLRQGTSEDELFQLFTHSGFGYRRLEPPNILFSCQTECGN